jgi:single-strand DNA-binding protein
MFQQIMLLGRLGNDPEMRYTPSGVPVTTFSLAVSRTWNDPNGQRQEKTTWFRINAWRRDAELASQYLSKGRQVLIIGELEEARAYTDKDGNQRASLEVTARTIRFVGSPNEGGSSGGGDFQREPARTQNNNGSSKAGGRAPEPWYDGPRDEDIPL